jgi:hypothetical protein
MGSESAFPCTFDSLPLNNTTEKLITRCNDLWNKFILMDRGGLLDVEKSRYESTAECLGSI